MAVIVISRSLFYDVVDIPVPSVAQTYAPLRMYYEF